MVKCAGGGTVTVFAGGQALPEYRPVGWTEGNISFKTCYIEAKEGLEYEVKVDNFSVIKRGKFEARLYIDGISVDSITECAPRTRLQRRRMKNEVSFEGRPALRDGKVILSAFAFSRMQTSKDDSAIDLLPEQLAELCSIRVELTQRTRIGDKYHEKSSEELEYELAVAPFATEDSKPAAWGLSTGLGREMVEEDSWTCYCTVADEPNPPKTVIIFKYRPHDWLDAELQAERGGPMEDDTDGVDEVYPDATSQIDQNATSLTRRRVREETADNSTSERNVRFRSDAPASVERVVKREPEEEREIGVQDHTQDCTLEPLVSDEIDVKTEPLSPSM